MKIETTTTTAKNQVVNQEPKMKRKVTPAIAASHNLKDEEVDYWHGLTDDEREHWFEIALHDINTSKYWENFYGKLGIRGAYGRGASLATAVSIAFGDSDIVEQRRAQQVEDRHNELHTCTQCGHQAPERYSVVAESAVCFPCARQMGGIALQMVGPETEDERETLVRVRS